MKVKELPRRTRLALATIIYMLFCVGFGVVIGLLLDLLKIVIIGYFEPVLTIVFAMVFGLLGLLAMLMKKDKLVDIMKEEE